MSTCVAVCTYAICCRVHICHMLPYAHTQEELREDWPLLFIAISAKWLSEIHPDPHGFHLAPIVEATNLYLHNPTKDHTAASHHHTAAPHTSPLVEACERRGVRTRQN